DLGSVLALILCRLLREHDALLLRRESSDRGVVLDLLVLFFDLALKSLQVPLERCEGVEERHRGLRRFGLGGRCAGRNTWLSLRWGVSGTLLGGFDHGHGTAPSPSAGRTPSTRPRSTYEPNSSSRATSPKAPGSKSSNSPRGTLMLTSRPSSAPAGRAWSKTSSAASVATNRGRPSAVSARSEES